MFAKQEGNNFDLKKILFKQSFRLHTNKISIERERYRTDQS